MRYQDQEDETKFTGLDVLIKNMSTFVCDLKKTILENNIFAVSSQTLAHGQIYLKILNQFTDAKKSRHYIALPAESCMQHSDTLKIPLLFCNTFGSSFLKVIFLHHVVFCR